jgi:hypothetical protein
VISLLDLVMEVFPESVPSMMSGVAVAHIRSKLSGPCPSIVLVSGLAARIIFVRET